MGEEFLENNNIPRKTYTEVFYEQLPLYLAIGMTLTEYFECDCMLTKYYREAHRIKQENEDYNAWLQGIYFYKAMNCAIYNNPPLMKKGKEAQQYFDKPITAQMSSEEETEEQKILKQEEADAKMGVWMSNFVNMFKDK